MWGARTAAWGLLGPGSPSQNRPLLQESEPIIPPELIIPGLLLADPRQGYAHPLYVALGVLFGLILIGSLLAYVLAPRLLRRHRLKTELLRRLAGALGLVSGLGLFWIVARIVGMPLFARPLWLWFTLLALVATVAYAAYYWVKRYPVRRRAYEETVRKRRWLPTPRRRATARRR